MLAADMKIHALDQTKIVGHFYGLRDNAPHVFNSKIFQFDLERVYSL